MPRLSTRRPSRRLAFAQRRLQARQLSSNKRLEARYADALVGVVRRLHADVAATIEPKLSQYAKPARVDAINPFSGDIDGVLIKHIQEAPKVVSPLFARHAQDVADENAKALRVVGIRPTDLRLGPVISTKRDENIRLVEKAMRAYAQDVRDVFEDPKTFGMRVEDIKERLLERGKVSESRAELIARDQTLKLNGAITKTRQENAGISRYVWSTSLDERVREEHRVLEGQTFDWSSPPPPGHPGEDFQCRCVAVPVIEGLGDVTDFPEVAQPTSPIIAVPPPVPPAPPPEPELERGIHFKHITTGPGVSDEEKTTLLRSLADEPTRKFLAQEPLNQIDILPEVFWNTIDKNGLPVRERVEGLYTPSVARQNTLQIATKRDASHLEGKLTPGKTFKVALAATTNEKATELDMRHELGHHVHLAEGLLGTKIDNIVDAAFQAAKRSGTFITQYAAYDWREYFAESYTAYIHYPAVLRSHDPNGYKMVENVLKERGML